MANITEAENFKAQMFSDDWGSIKNASNNIFRIGRQENYEYLLSLLDQKNPLIRNAVALTCRDNKFDLAIESLLKAIKKPENLRTRGTLVYALEKLNCSQKLVELFDILFTGINNWEVQTSILTILEEQIFDFSEEDLLKIKAQWEVLKPNWNSLQNINKNDLKEIDIHEDLIQEFVDGFLDYLK